ncbi:hypothetical protein E4U60_007158 [Claviceps pazoutovae]|uniref:Uncharacterized protein n=1 Tax=Claviceps pazoutovae TaxID=1649127 RepID=A0A9P7SIX5_9HYPO|nr:hypothetical protein E4U60_007158 [Claviceps pazoutovae]
MTKQFRRSSLLQTSDSQPHSHSHSHAHSHSLSRRLRHSPFHSQDSPNPEDQRKRSKLEIDDPASGNKISVEGEIDSVGDPLSNHDASDVFENGVVNAVGGTPTIPVIHVVHTIALVIDPWGAPFKTQTLSATPNTPDLDTKTDTANTATTTTMASSSDTASLQPISETTTTSAAAPDAAISGSKPGTTQTTTTTATTSGTAISGSKSGTIQTTATTTSGTAISGSKPGTTQTTTTTTTASSAASDTAVSGLKPETAQITTTTTNARPAAPDTAVSGLKPGTAQTTTTTTTASTAASTPPGAAPPVSASGGSLRASSAAGSSTMRIPANAKVTSVGPFLHTTKSALPSMVDIRNSSACKLLKRSGPRHVILCADSIAVAIFSSNSTSFMAPTDTSSFSSTSTSTSHSGPVLLPTSELSSTNDLHSTTTSSQPHTTVHATGTGTATSFATTTGTATTIRTSTITGSTSRESSFLSSAQSTTTDLDGGYGTLTVPGSLPSSPAAGTKSNGGGAVNLTPQQKQVIGGVVGSIAGVALIGFLLMMFLRHKKRKGPRFLLDSHSGPAAGRYLGDAKTLGGPAGGASGTATTERSAASGALAATLAALTGKRPPPTPPPTAPDERGFYRVSGRKLPSVLQSGGDGYSDPRASAASGNSDYFRGSQAFEPVALGSGQLALGAPMRPVSGLPVIRSGPARIAVTENPFIDPRPPITPTNLSSRTLASRGSPRASGSRFHEGL